MSNNNRHGSQASLPGFDAAPAPTDRLFFAIFPDTDTAERIAQLAWRLRGEHGLNGKLVETERLHVTLHHLGDFVGVPRDIVARAGEAAAAVAMPPFEVTFNRAMSFSGRPDKRPFVLLGGDGLAALKAFQRTLGTAMEKAGLKLAKADANYTPHVTLLYGDLLVAEQAVETVAWTAREFVLVRSLLGQGVHVPLARWALHP